MPPTSFDNDDFPPVVVRELDPHGQAALMLCESTLHTLIEAGVLTVQEAIGVVATALELKNELAQAPGRSGVAMEESRTLLKAISASLKTDLPSVAAF